MKLIDQIIDIRDSGLTNMLDANAVQRIAFERGYYELVSFIEESKGSYARFIMTGKLKQYMVVVEWVEVGGGTDGSEPSRFDFGSEESARSFFDEFDVENEWKVAHRTATVKAEIERLKRAKTLYVYDVDEYDKMVGDYEELEHEEYGEEA